MNRDKVKAFIKKHEMAITVGASLALGTVAYAVIGKSFRLPKNEGVSLPDVRDGIRDIAVPTGFAVGKVTDLWEEKDEIVAIVQDITAKDIGNLGREFVKHGIIAEATEACVTVEFRK